MTHLNSNFYLTVFSFFIRIRVFGCLLFGQADLAFSEFILKRPHPTKKGGIHFFSLNLKLRRRKGKDEGRPHLQAKFNCFATRFKFMFACLRSYTSTSGKRIAFSATSNDMSKTRICVLYKNLLLFC